MELRPYQRAAVDAVYNHLRERDDNPCVVIPTAGGKTLVMATLCSDAVQRWHGRVLILAHVKELLEQIAEKLRTMAPELPFGIYSAGLRRRDLGQPVTVAGIQSVYQRACDIGPVDLVIVDECHLIPPDGEGMYRTFLEEAKTINPRLRVIGMTATPYRMKSGEICGTENILNHACYEISVRDLIEQGFLCGLRTKSGSEKADFESLHVRGGEFVADEVEAMMDTDRLVRSASKEIIQHTTDRKSVLIFASGIAHGEHLCKVLADQHQVECGFVCGDTLPFERSDTLERFRRGELKYLCNVNVLTTGFDAPTIDCVALVRPTKSPGLYYQMVGRGFRLNPGKTDCLVLDFGGNVQRHGPVDAIRVRSGSNGTGDAPVKECPECHELVPAGCLTCSQCGYRWPERTVAKHDAKASSENILSGPATRAEHEVLSTSYAIHTKRGAPEDAPRSMRVYYKLGFNDYACEWICVEHGGYARQKAEAWWRRRSNEAVPATAAEAVELANAGALAKTAAVTVEHKPGEKFDKIVAHRLGDKPPRLESELDLPGEPSWLENEEVPF